MVDGMMTNRLAITKPITVRSVNGPAVTIISGRANPVSPNGNDAVRCSYIGANAVLSGFTLANGHTRTMGDSIKEQYGGGVWCSMYATVNNCKLTGNSANFKGGGSYQGTLNNCTLTGNSALFGGGSYNGTLNNCTVASNSAMVIGGAYDCVMNNCIMYFNYAPNSDPSNNPTIDSRMNYCCTTEMPTIGTGNITNDPQFVDVASSNFSLRCTSPCIDAGLTRSWMTNEMDIAGRPRLMNGRVDMGANEFRFESSLKGLLAGAWDVTNATMRSGGPPTTSPYGAAATVVTNVPPNVVDWVLVSVRESPTNKSVASVSAFLMPDRTILNADGGTNVYVEAKGNLYGVLQHRNHLAVMSAAPIFTNSYVQFDFSADPNLLWGGTNTVIKVSTNRWGMIPGDADSDGEIGVPDILIHKIQAP